MAPPPTSLSPPVAFVAVGVLTLWSGTAVANKIAVGAMDPMTAGVLRSLVAGVLAVGIVSVARLRKPSGFRDHALLLFSGVASFAVWPMLLSLGLGWTTAGHAALIMAVIPVFTSSIGAALERRLLPRGWWVGVGAALAGTTLLVLERSGGGGVSELPGTLRGDLVILLGSFVCAAGYVAGGRSALAIGTWATTFRGLASALIVLVPVFLLRVDRTDWSAVGPAGWGAIAYMAVLSSIVGYAGWFWALGRGGVARIGSWQLGQPVGSLVLAALVLGERFTPLLSAAACAIVVGTGWAQFRAAPPRSAGPEEVGILPLETCARPAETGSP